MAVLSVIISTAGHSTLILSVEISTKYLTVQMVAVQVKSGKAIVTGLLILFGQNLVK